MSFDPSKPSVEARMTCTKNEVIHSPGSEEFRRTRLDALYSTGGNESWSKYTPQAYAELVITNPGAFEQFEPGETYAVFFQKIEKQTEA